MHKKLFRSTSICLGILLTLLIIFVPHQAFASCSHTTLGPQYSEASHPHEYYRQCATCGEKIYTGGHATKKHGDGSWGSGTCPDCGTHSYVGRSCTSRGECACGATIAAYGHTYGRVYYDSEHPHYGYKRCSRCSNEIRAGSTTFEHGPESNTTCPLCGDHDYEVDPSSLEIHPHPLKWICFCGDSYISDYGFSKDCSTCMAIAETEYVYDEAPLSLLKFEDDVTGSLPIVTTIRVGLTYEETYLRNGTEFVSLEATSEAEILVVPTAYRHEISATANARIEYFDDDGQFIFSAGLLPEDYPLSMDYSSLVGDTFTDSPFPTYSEPGVSAVWDGGFTPGFYYTTATYEY